MAKLQDKLFNRIIQGDLKELSEKDKEVLQQYGVALQSKSPQVFNVNDEVGSVIPKDIGDKLKVGDIVNFNKYTDIGHIVLYVSFEDNNKLFQICCFDDSELNVYTYEYDISADNYDVSYSFLLQLSDVPIRSEVSIVHGTELGLDELSSDYIRNLKVGDIIKSHGSGVVAMVITSNPITIRTQFENSEFTDYIYEKSGSTWSFSGSTSYDFQLANSAYKGGYRIGFVKDGEITGTVDCQKIDGTSERITLSTTVQYVDNVVSILAVSITGTHMESFNNCCTYVVNNNGNAKLCYDDYLGELGISSVVIPHADGLFTIYQD